jgi:hypothetical protein
VLSCYIKVVSALCIYHHLAYSYWGWLVRVLTAYGACYALVLVVGLIICWHAMLCWPLVLRHLQAFPECSLASAWLGFDAATAQVIMCVTVAPWAGPHMSTYEAKC